MLINDQCMAQQTFDITKGSGALKLSGAAVVSSFPADALEDRRLLHPAFNYRQRCVWLRCK